jgi:hypothetical protein
MVKKRTMVDPNTILGTPQAVPKKDKKDNNEDNVIKPSPFKKLNFKKKAAAKKAVTIYHVLPPVLEDGEELGLEGYIILVEGLLQLKVATAMYKKNSDDKAMLFCDATSPVPHVFQFHQGGVPLQREANNGKSYDTEVLVHLLTEEEPATKEQLFQFVEGTFIPALMKQKKFFQNAKPILPSTKPYVIVKFMVRHSW